jgi:hypothetical protein
MNWPASSLAEEAFLSYVGEPFDYDVFVSYVHAENETGASLLRDWSKHVASALTQS